LIVIGGAPWSGVLRQWVLRSIASRLLICAAIVVAVPIGAGAAAGGSSTSHVYGTDQVALGPAASGDARLIPSAARKPGHAGRLSVVLGLAPPVAAAPELPDGFTLLSSPAAPRRPALRFTSAKTSRGPPPDGSSVIAS
jgi:hypothetical protein